jgi:B-box zinc finger
MLPGRGSWLVTRGPPAHHNSDCYLSIRNHSSHGDDGSLTQLPSSLSSSPSSLSNGRTSTEPIYLEKTTKLIYKRKKMVEDEQSPGTLPPPTPNQKPCDFCTDTPAVVYCRADTASLCFRCDREVHTANTVSSRHTRSILCGSCSAAPATFVCSCRGFLCSNCDFESHGGDHTGHVRRGLEGYTGCPSASEMAALVGVAIEECEKGGWEGLVGAGSRWEMEKVVRLEDLIVPTTCHGFHALETTPLIKVSVL